MHIRLASAKDQKAIQTIYTQVRLAHGVNARLPDKMRKSAERSVWHQC